MNFKTTVLLSLLCFPLLAAQKSAAPVKPGDIVYAYNMALIKGQPDTAISYLSKKFIADCFKGMKKDMAADTASGRQMLQVFGYKNLKELESDNAMSFYKHLLTLAMKRLVTLTDNNLMQIMVVIQNTAIDDKKGTASVTYDLVFKDETINSDNNKILLRLENKVWKIYMDLPE
jgi:hypothetical protein